MDTLALKFFLISVLAFVVTKAASLPKAEPSQGRLQGQLGDRPYYIAYACERTILSLQCDGGSRIHLVHATYGRQNMRHCTNNGYHPEAMMWSRHCTAPVRRTTGVVAEMCNGREVCMVPVVNMLFSDPCPTTYKYLEIYYTCIQP